MRPQAHSVLVAEPRTVPHRAHVAGVPAAGHIGGGDPAHQRPRARQRLALSQITIDVHVQSSDETARFGQADTAPATRDRRAPARPVLDNRRSCGHPASRPWARLLTPPGWSPRASANSRSGEAPATVLSPSGDSRLDRFAARPSTLARRRPCARIPRTTATAAPAKPEALADASNHAAPKAAPT